MGWGRIIVALWFLSPSAMGALSLDAGVYATHLEDRFYVPNEFRPKVSHVTGMLRVRPMFHLGKNWFFEPAMGLLLPWHSGADGNVKFFTAHFDLGVSIPIFSFLAFRLGPGLQWTGILSSGGEVQLNNGSSSNVSTFYTPGKFSSTYLFTVQGALVIKIRRVSLSFEVYAADVMSRLRRTLDGAVMLGVRL